MAEITFEYWNELAEQTILISSLLGGFSIAVVANIMVSDLNTRLSNTILTVSTLAACLFLVSVFAMTTVLLKTTDGYPFEVIESEFRFPRLLGAITMFFGVFSLIVMISLSGWTKSSKIGILTTIFGTLTLILFVVVIT